MPPGSHRIQLQQSNLPERMKVWEALDLYASFYPKTANWRQLLVQLGLEEKRDVAFKKLSGGQKQRLFIALSLLPDPQLVFLDELTTGLDPQARHAIWDLVREVRGRGKTILLTTHFMEEAERLCDRVAILDHGRIVALDTPAALIRSIGREQRVVFNVERSLPSGFEKGFSSETRVEVQGEQVTVSSRNGRKVPLVSEVVNLLNHHRVQFRDLRSEQPTLEDVFLSLTGREMRE
jgi:ABC-2 type transport system ATP-binding protein